MDSYNSNFTLNQKQNSRNINHAGITSILPITLQSDINQVTNQGDNFLQINTLKNKRRITNLPISISNVQRNSIVQSRGITNTHYNHEQYQSRIGELMYQNGGIKTIKQEILPNRFKTRFLQFLIFGVLALLLLIFVIFCIWNHINNPQATNSLNYYLHHPDRIRDSFSSETILLEKQKQSIKLRQKQIQHNDDRIQMPLFDNNCREGLYYLNGLCYPCKVDQNSENKCSVSSVKQQITKKQNISEKLPLQIQNIYYQKCKQDEKYENGKCLLCPLGSSWKGDKCQRNQNSINNFKIQ